MALDEYRRVNRANWDERVSIHLESRHYDVAGFIEHEARLSRIVRFGRANIDNVRGKTMLHLMCHIGLDSLSWARLGAEVTGVDFSPRVIEAARRFAHDAGLDARFVEVELYDVPQAIHERFDIVYTSIGVLCWVPEVSVWARMIAGALKSGGTFLMTEIHPIAWTLDQERKDSLLRMTDPYFESEVPTRMDEEQTYTDGDAMLEQSVTYEWNHGIGEIVTALIEAGLRIEFVREYPFVYGWDALPAMERDADGKLRLTEGSENVPLMYSIRAMKPGR